MKRFLVVDDMQVRHNEFDRILTGGQVLHTYNVREGILQIQEDLRDEKKFDTIFLDHDIEGGDDRRDVIELVHWIVETPWVRDHLKKNGTNFFIHSWNNHGAQNMKALLEDAGFNVKVKPFRIG